MTNTVITTTGTRGVTTITLNRAKKHNAFDDQMVSRLTMALKKIMANSKTRVLVLAAEGTTFSAGADLDWMKRVGTSRYEDNLRDAEALADMLKTMNEMPLPTIAKVQGPAFGGALGLISCCDISIATTNASFSFSEVKIGLIPATISPYIIDAIGAHKARHYFMTGETFDARQAAQLGLINKVVEETQLNDATAQLIATLLKNSPAAMRAAKQLAQDVGRSPMSDALIKETCRRIADIRLSQEGQEGLSAFLEKRKPSWQRG